MELKNTKILLTGGSLGIGKATAKKLIDAGAKVLITGRNAARLEMAANEIGALWIENDIGNYDSIDGLYVDAMKQLGGIDVLINNAGIGTFPELGEIEVSDFEKIFSVNVFGLAMLTQKVAEVFKEQSSGNIVNIASTAGTKGFARGTVYAASKFAVRGMTQCWQAELRKHNVRVMLINPSEVTTAFADDNRKERPEELKKLRSEEIAHAIVGALQMDNRGFIPELTVWATNPF